MTTALLLLTGWAVIAAVALVFNYALHEFDNDDDDDG